MKVLPETSVKKKGDSEFGKEFRRIRDGDLSPRDAWVGRMRKCTGNTETFHTWAFKPFEHFEVKDMEEMLLNAARTENVTCIQVHFRSPSTPNPKALNKKANILVKSLVKAGFGENGFLVNVNEVAVGFIGFELYTEGELPGVLLETLSYIN